MGNRLKKKAKILFSKIVNNQDQSEIIKKSSSFLLFRFIGILAGYLFTYIIAKNYGAAVNGLVALSFTVFLIVSVVGRLGVDANIIKYFSIESNWKNNSSIFYTVLLKSIIFSILLATFVYIFREFIAVNIFNKPQLEPYFLWITLAIPFWVIVINCSCLLRAKKLNNWFAFLNNPGRFLFTLFFMALLSLLSTSELNAIKAHFYGILVLSAIGFIICVKQIGPVSLKSTDKTWNFLKDAFPMMISTSLIIVLGWMDTLVLGVYETDNIVGIYNVALKITAIIALALEAISSILAPKIASLYYEKEYEKLSSLIKFSTRTIFISSLVITIVLFLFHKSILNFFGEEFTLGSSAFLILCLAPLIAAFSGSIGIILQMIGKQKIHQNFVFIAFVINLIMNFILVPKYGMNGAAITTVVSMFVWNFLGVWYLKTRHNLKSYFNF